MKELPDIIKLVFKGSIYVTFYVNKQHSRLVNVLLGAQFDIEVRKVSCRMSKIKNN